MRNHFYDDVFLYDMDLKLKQESNENYNLKGKDHKFLKSMSMKNESQKYISV